MKNFLFVLIIVTIIFSVSGFIFEQRKNSSTSLKPKTTVRIAYSAFVSPIFIALEKKYFEQHGIKPVLIYLPSSVNSLQALAKGEIDVLSAPYSNLFSFENTFPGKFKLFAGFVETKDRPYSYLIVKDNILTINDLIGKKIITRSGSNAKMQATLIIKGLGLNLQDIEIVQVESPLVTSTFAKDEISAVIDNEPTSTSVLKKVGGKILVSGVRTKYLTEPYASTGLIMSTKFMNTNKEIADSFVKETDRAIEYSRKNDKESRLIMAKYIKITKEVALSMSQATFEKSTELNKNTINNEMLLELNNKLLKKAVDFKYVFFK